MLRLYSALVRDGLFKWIALGIAAIGGAVVIWMVNDVRTELKRTNAIVTEQLPAILENAKQVGDTMARLAKDIDALRNLAGVGAARDKSLAVYADSIMDFLDKQPGQIGLEKVIGKELKELVPVSEWVAAARKEALWLTFRANTKADLLDRLGKTKFGSPWMYAPPGGPPTTLIDLLKTKHSESAGL
jgi:hypothetical protein